VYAFSSDNWKRPLPEVNALMKLFHQYLRKEQARCVEKGMRVSVIGRRDRLPRMLLPSIEEIEEVTAAGESLHLRLAVDYSSRDAMWSALRQLPPSASRDDVGAVLGPDVDLLIRSGGEQRISDFLLWECAYAELWFTSKMWPDFQASDLKAAMTEFSSRERRFGAVRAAALA
jgi:undecaprenyl diphosphate synthase